MYGTLKADDPAFTEETGFAPNSPYAASKAGSDHFARAYFHTYGLPVLTTNCSNNYGPHQFPEKLIPLMILNALDGKPLAHLRRRRQHPRLALRRRPLRGHQPRAGRPAAGRDVQRRRQPRAHEPANRGHPLPPRSTPSARAPTARSYSEQKTFVADRPGHDRRYAVNSGKLQRELGWTPAESFDTGLEKTIRWYLANRGVVRKGVSADKYSRERLGLVRNSKKRIVSAKIPVPSGGISEDKSAKCHLMSFNP